MSLFFVILCDFTLKFASIVVGFQLGFVGVSCNCVELGVTVIRDFEFLLILWIFSEFVLGLFFRVSWKVLLMVVRLKHLSPPFPACVLF